MSTVAKISRRTFLRLSGGATAALVLGVHLPGRARAAAGVNALTPNAWLSIDEAGAVTVWVIRSEMGQGVLTSMPMLVAEQLDADWSKVKVTQALTNPKYGRMATGGSTSVRRSWEPLQKAGAAARMMLVAAAARRWGVPPETCTTKSGAVVDSRGRRLSYGELAAAASKHAVPPDPRLKAPAEFQLLGKPVARLDTPEKVNGKGIFGLDVRLPGMLFATVARCPVRGGKVKAVREDAALRVPGVRQVLEVPSGVAVIADSTWAAIRGREALKLTFEPGPNAGLDSSAISVLLADPKAKLDTARQEGDFAAAFAAAPHKVEAVYEFPFLAHATMEPMNSTARVGPGGAEIWSPTQQPTWAQDEVAKALGFPTEKVLVHTTLLGGGFGRRSMPDVPVEAAHVARAAGAPVQVVWTREDDMVHDFFRPVSRNVLSAGLDAQGGLAAWRHTVRAPSVAAQILRPRGRPPRRRRRSRGRPLPRRRGPRGQLHADARGDDRLVAVRVLVPERLCRGVLRGRACAEGGQGSVRLPPGSPRRRSAAARCARARRRKGRMGGALGGRAGSGHRLSRLLRQLCRRGGRGLGGGGEVRVHRMVAAVDCGRIVNPNTIEAQVESAVAYGLGAALRGAITIRGGAAVQKDFEAYAPLRMHEMPRVEVHRVPSDEPPGGIGEPGLPPVAPAVLNALAAATGIRVRKLPIGKLGAQPAPGKT